MSPSFDSSSHSITSHYIPQKHEPRNITFGDMHPEASSNEDKNSSKARFTEHKVTSSQDNGQRRTTSHKKYDF
jgi:hypothetical protein